MLCYITLSASIDWGCAVQVAAAINIANQNFVATEMETLCVCIAVDLALLTFIQWDLRGISSLTWDHLFSRDCRPCEATKSLHISQYLVSIPDTLVWYSGLR